MVAASPEKAGTIAGTADSDGNFARFVGYCRDIETGFEGVQNLRLKLCKFNRLLAKTMTCWLQIGCRISQTFRDICNAQPLIALFSACGPPREESIFRAKPMVADDEGNFPLRCRTAPASPVCRAARRRLRHRALSRSGR